MLLARLLVKNQGKVKCFYLLAGPYHTANVLERHDFAFMNCLMFLFLLFLYVFCLLRIVCCLNLVSKGEADIYQFCIDF